MMKNQRVFTLVIDTDIEDERDMMVELMDMFEGRAVDAHIFIGPTKVVLPENPRLEGQYFRETAEAVKAHGGLLADWAEKNGMDHDYDQG